MVATLDSRTSEVCQEMDGKHFSMKDFVAGSTAPPFHPWCRSCTAPYFDDELSQGERAARDEEGNVYYVPESMKYPEWKKSFVDGDPQDDLKPLNESIIIEVNKENIQELSKLKDSGMTEDDYGEYLGIINDHHNSSIRNIYSKHADNISGVEMTSSKGAAYSPSSNSLTFDYPKYDDMNKYGTLAHEYGHYFDAEVDFDGVHFREIESVRNITGLDMLFRNKASSSDEFLEAIRKDKEHY